MTNLVCMNSYGIEEKNEGKKKEKETNLVVRSIRIYFLIAWLKLNLLSNLIIKMGGNILRVKLIVRCPSDLLAQLVRASC